ncbi:Preprotein translocase subunit SecB [Pelotomaculum schinkii]|uniref:Preprotein translocase subunit SecB n=1 Tax=Pelotomaculum schinkii TaxID=78350 RepID=A0A4Y7RBV6_9FIRM|nr:protein-export chaperone SecB [Pelotomaculum schinkii]TEB06498.1 Preprotein translocase subunit SecB [Pelotomaculum schinkii]
MDKPVLPHPVQLHEVVLEKINCRRIGNFSPKASYRMNFAVRTKSISKTEAYGYLCLKVFFDGQPNVFSMEIIVRGKFIDENATNRSMLKRFAERQSLPLLLPWAREAVSSLTRRMGYPPLLIPLIDVSATLRTKEV